MEILVKLFGTKIFKKVLFSVLGVLVKQTDNKLDDEILESVKKCFE